jgi:hypothetical protein
MPTKIEDALSPYRRHQKALILFVSNLKRFAGGEVDSRGKETGQKLLKAKRPRMRERVKG